VVNEPFAPERAEHRFGNEYAIVHAELAMAAKKITQYDVCRTVEPEDQLEHFR
jgi:hypothetical protein